MGFVLPPDPLHLHLRRLPACNTEPRYDIVVLPESLLVVDASNRNPSENYEGSCILPLGMHILHSNMVRHLDPPESIDNALTVLDDVRRSARLSILFSIIRIDTDQVRRKRMLGIAGVFLLVCMTLIGQLFWVCEREPHWKDRRIPQCNLGKQVAICQLVCEWGRLFFSFTRVDDEHSGHDRGYYIDRGTSETPVGSARQDAPPPTYDHLLDLCRHHDRLPRPRCLHYQKWRSKDPNSSRRRGACRLSLGACFLN